MRSSHAHGYGSSYYQHESYDLTIPRVEGCSQALMNGRPLHLRIDTFAANMDARRTIKEPTRKKKTFQIPLFS